MTPTKPCAIHLALAGVAAICVACSDDDPNAGMHTWTCSCVCKDPSFPVGSMYTAEVCANDSSEAYGDCKTQCGRRCKRGKLFVDSVKRTHDDFCVYRQLLAYREPDATFEGLLDPVRSTLELTNKKDGAKAFAKVEGELAMSGGLCPGAKCPIKLTQVFFRSTKPFMLSGKKVTGLKAQNHGIWSGDKGSSGSIRIDSPGLLSVAGRVDGKYKSSVTAVEGFINGKLESVMRNKGTKYERTNALLVDASFVDGNIQMLMHLHVWLADCRPRVTAHASCVMDPDGAEARIQLNGVKAQMIPNAGQIDLCNAVDSGAFTTQCTSDEEFSCFRGSDVVSQKLTFVWTDADGKPIGNKPMVFVSGCLSYPLTLTVTNAWGRFATRTIWTGPTHGPCAAKCAKLAKPDTESPMMVAPGDLQLRSAPSVAFDPARCKDTRYRAGHAAECAEWEAATAPRGRRERR